MRVLFWILMCSPFLVNAQCIQGDCNNGIGIYLFPSGAKYSGSFQNGKLNGIGKLIFSNGDIYQGDWKNQHRHGKGTLLKANGEKYTGSFVQSKFQGHGSYHYMDGSVYTGNWIKNKRNGHGVLVQVDGKQLEGTWKENQFKPSNDQVTSNSNISAANNRPINEVESTNHSKKLKNCNTSYCHDCEGIFTYRDGSKYTGQFYNGKPEGTGICFYANGDRYEGTWKNHAPHGKGKMYFRNGRVVYALWNFGRATKFIEDEVPIVMNKQQNKPVADPDVKIWAAVVGVASYNHMPTLKYTDDDAYRMYAFLKSPEGGALPDHQIRLLIDEDATQAKIIKGMQDLFWQADDNDVVLLYLSGHGLKGSFLPFDFDGFHNRLRYEDIRTILDQSDAKQKICLADACYAGTFTGTKTTSLQSSLKNFYSLINDASAGTAFLLSSKTGEVSLEDQGLRQGIFSHYLIRGLKGVADVNRDKIIQLGELFDYVTREVKRYTGNRQSPEVAGKFDAQLPIAFIR